MYIRTYIWARPLVTPELGRAQREKDAMETPILSNAGPSRESALVTDLGTSGPKLGDRAEDCARLPSAESNMFYPWQVARRTFGRELPRNLRNR